MVQIPVKLAKYIVKKYRLDQVTILATKEGEPDQVVRFGKSKAKQIADAVVDWKKWRAKNDD